MHANRERKKRQGPFHQPDNLLLFCHTSFFGTCCLRCTSNWSPQTKKGRLTDNNPIPLEMKTWKSYAVFTLYEIQRDRVRTPNDPWKDLTHKPLTTIRYSQSKFYQFQNVHELSKNNSMIWIQTKPEANKKKTHDGSRHREVMTMMVGDDHHHVLVIVSDQMTKVERSLYLLMNRSH